jgi:hypothetical protein
MGGGVSGRLRRFWSLLRGFLAEGPKRGPTVRVLCGVPSNLGIIDQVGPVPFRHDVLRIGYQERARLVELVRLPAGVEGALSQDEVDFAAFPHAQADAGIHLRAHRAFAHGILARPLGRGDQFNRHGPAPAGHRISVLARFIGHFRVFVHDDHQRRAIRCRFPGALAGSGHQGVIPSDTHAREAGDVLGQANVREPTRPETSELDITDI